MTATISVPRPVAVVAMFYEFVELGKREVVLRGRLCVSLSVGYEVTKLNQIQLRLLAVIKFSCP